MASARNVNLTPQLAEFVEQNVASGLFQNASEVVRAALRLLARQQREDELKLEALRRAVATGLDDMEQGRFASVDPGGLGTFLAGLGPES
jgi:antitoxin ParD1/3/4